MIRAFFSILFLIIALTVQAQNPLLRKHIKTDSFKYEIYISKTELSRFKLNDSLYYHWCKAQKIMITQGGVDGNVLDGDYIKFYRSGQLAEKGKMRMGLKHGYWKTWYADGNLATVYRYRHGRKHGSYAIFDGGGDIIEEGTFKHDKLIDESEEGWFKRLLTKKKSEEEEKQDKENKKWFKKQKGSSKAQKEKKRLKENEDQE